MYGRREREESIGERAKAVAESLRLAAGVGSPTTFFDGSFRILERIPEPDVFLFVSFVHQGFFTLTFSFETNTTIENETDDSSGRVYGSNVHLG